MHMRRYYGLLTLVLAMFSGCGTGIPLDVPIIYPPPPEEPKIVYLRSYRGEADYQKRGFFDSLFGTPLSPGLAKPYGVYASGGKIYVTLTGGAAVAVIDTKEKKVSYLGFRGTAKLALPIGVAGASDGTIFVSDGKLKRVFGYDASGALRVAIGKKGEFMNPAGIAINNKLGRLYIVDSFGHKVHVYSLNGKPLFTFGRRGSDKGEFNYPSNVAVDRRTGNVYITDTQNFRIQLFDGDGKFIRMFGEVGDRLGNFARPKGIGVDSDGHVYVADAAFDNFQIFNEKGEIRFFIGGAGVDAGYFQLPAGLYVDENDTVYVVDQLNSRVQVYQYLSEQWKKAHPEGYKKYLPPEQASQETRE